MLPSSDSVAWATNALASKLQEMAGSSQFIVWQKELKRNIPVKCFPNALVI